MKKFNLVALSAFVTLSLYSANSLARNYVPEKPILLSLLTLQGNDKKSFEKQLEQNQKLYNNALKKLKDDLNSEEKKLTNIADLKSKKVFAYVNDAPRDLITKFNITANKIYNSFFNEKIPSAFRSSNLDEIILDLYGDQKDKNLSKPFEDCLDRAKSIKKEQYFELKLTACVNEVFTRYATVKRYTNLVNHYESQLDELKNIQYKLKNLSSLEGNYDLTNTINDFNYKTRQIDWSYYLLKTQISKVDNIFEKANADLKKLGAKDRNFVDKVFESNQKPIRKLKKYKYIYDWLTD